MKPKFIPYQPLLRDIEDVQARARAHHEFMADRRTIRDFGPDPVPREVIEDLVRTASSAPSGAHRQPWTFVAVGDAETKRRIREAAEEEERRTYGGRMPDEWRAALEPLGTDAHKPFLEIAPWLVVMFRQDHGVTAAGETVRHYYVSESCGIAAGFFIAAVHQAGLFTLTHTPSPMKFLGEILGRPKHEKPFLLMPVGYPAKGLKIPDLTRKPIDEVLTFVP